VPDDSTAPEPVRPTPEQFDEFLRISAARSLVALFDQALGPFPPHVEPFSHVTREGLERVFAELRLEPGDHLVDLCCGRGGIGLWFARESGARLTGIDFSPVAVAEAERRAGLFVADGQASFVVADARQTSLERQSADAVVCIDSLQLFPDGKAVLREAGSLLRSDGRIVLTTWELDETPPGRTPMPDVGRVAEDAGLQVVLREEHPEWLEGQQRLYENVLAADSEDAEQAIRWTADEARSFLPRIADARRVLLVAARPAE
jgi:SAM-dependent methyltransferase